MNNIIEWNGYFIKEIESSDGEIFENFDGIFATAIDKDLKELYELKDGLYEVEGINLLLKILTIPYMKNNSLHYNKLIEFSLSLNNVFYNSMCEIEHRNHQEKEGAIQAEIMVFEKDLNTDLVFINNKAQLKPYYHKSLEIRKENVEQGDEVFYKLLIDGYGALDISYNKRTAKYHGYDGVDGYGDFDTLKQLVKYYMDSSYRYPSEDGDFDEPTCNTCGDGGCWHCEPQNYL